jgi:hypothetical protein
LAEQELIAEIERREAEERLKSVEDDKKRELEAKEQEKKDLEAKMIDEKQKALLK